MRASLANTAQLTMDMEVDMDKAVKLRARLVDEWTSEGIRVSYTDLIVFASAKALLEHPRINSAFVDNAIVSHNSVNIGIAVALEEGLVVPVIHDLSSKDLKTVARLSAELAQKARSGSLELEDVQGGAFTVTSLGMYGVDSFTPILNAPQTGILGVGRIYDALAWEGDTPKKCQRMRLSLTWDHQVLDGAPAAEFLANIRAILESPDRLLV
jgi:pyruvate dehydrogenase E2 component (dihydrolipoamide acetyltransferase)